MDKRDFHSHTHVVAYPSLIHANKGLRLLNAGLSDRMSRPIMTLLLPSPPTASQVMMADSENGIVEAKNLHIFAACCEWAAWALHVAYGWWHFLSLSLRW